MADVLNSRFEAQRAAFAKDRSPNLATRIERVVRLRQMVIDCRQTLRDALA